MGVVAMVSACVLSLAIGLERLRRDVLARRHREAALRYWRELEERRAWARARRHEATG